ncbi:hypothetical protein EW146_g6211 [Bondarzewia mesenterica]|uniref:Uncharacterized protein n=1 Tax=Bondarzewia mesenterica TaxID=1095465 RepID=A0A4S4LPA7_9AGAM|nr:hypothetical protein EW146_g6211 [Bondarzewia mesenterica]
MPASLEHGYFLWNLLIMHALLIIPLAAPNAILSSNLLRMQLHTLYGLIAIVSHRIIALELSLLPPCPILDRMGRHLDDCILLRLGVFTIANGINVPAIRSWQQFIVYWPDRASHYVEKDLYDGLRMRPSNLGYMDFFDDLKEHGLSPCCGHTRRPSCIAIGLHCLVLQDASIGTAFSAYGGDFIVSSPRLGSLASSSGGDALQYALHTVTVPTDRVLCNRETSHVHLTMKQLLIAFALLGMIRVLKHIKRSLI